MARRIHPMGLRGRRVARMKPTAPIGASVTMVTNPSQGGPLPAPCCTPRFTNSKTPPITNKVAVAAARIQAGQGPRLTLASVPIPASRKRYGPSYWASEALGRARARELSAGWRRLGHWRSWLPHFAALFIDQQIVTPHLHHAGPNRPLGGSADHRAGGHVEPAAVTRTCDHRPRQLTLSERTPHVRARVVERV